MNSSASIPPQCPEGHGTMMYLTHIPFVVNGKAKTNDPAKAIRYGCVSCGSIIELETGNRAPINIEALCKRADEEANIRESEFPGLASLLRQLASVITQQEATIHNKEVALEAYRIAEESKL